MPRCEPHAPVSETLWAVYSPHGTRVSGLYPFKMDAIDSSSWAGRGTWKSAYDAGYRCLHVRVIPEGGSK